jgi:uncharacterized membrane protein
MTAFPGRGYVGGGGGRLGYLDTARGVAVLVMIHTHAFYSWVRPEDRGTRLFGLTRLIGGYPAPIFLFLAGLAAALVAEREWDKGATGEIVLRRGIRRALTVVGYAFLFRLAMLASGSFGRPADLFRVDVLNCIAASLMLVALTLTPARRTGRIAVALGVAALVALATPLVWDGKWWPGWPNAIAGYFTGRVLDSFFPIFPWAAFAALGAACGVLLSRARVRGREGRAVVWMVAVGALCVPAGLLVDRYTPSAYPKYDFWYTSPSYQIVKAGIVLVVLGLAWLLDRLPGPSPLRQLGRTSLFIYWLHLEVVYGQWIAPDARGTLPIGTAAWGVAALVIAMLAASLLRTSVTSWRLSRGRVVEEVTAKTA